MGRWLNFSKLREEIDFAAVLTHYGVVLKLRKGEQHQGPCPLPTHQGDNRSRSFSANVKRGVFRCFSPSCQNACGNAIDFVAMMEGLDPQNGSDIRRAALILSEKFAPHHDQAEHRGRMNGHDKAKPVQEEKSEPAPINAAQVPTCPAIVNAPLDFQLKLDAQHSYLQERGFTPETIAHFGLGYSARGSLEGRIAIPIHDPSGQLVGYAGRLVDDGQISKEDPRYRFPSPRQREGKRYEFAKRLLLYNSFAAGSDLADLIVVEGFASTWWLWQHGYPNVVALMGDSCSSEQATLIAKLVRPDGRVWLLSDGDQGGELCGQSLVPMVAPHRFVRWIRLGPGQQPTSCSSGELAALLHPLSHEKGANDGDV